MSLDLLMEYASKESYKEEQQVLDDLQQPFKGPTKFTSQIDPIDGNDFTVKAPTITSLFKKERLTPPSIIDQRKRSRLIIPPSPLQQQSEEPQKDIPPPTKLETFQQTNPQPQQGGLNLFKIVMAKSYFNQFVENMLQKSYVRKPQHFNAFLNSLMDDLIYFYQKGKYKKSWLEKGCKYFKCLPIFDQSSYYVICWQIFHILTILIIFFWTPFNVSFGITYDQRIFESITVKDIEYYFLVTIVVDFIVIINTNFIDKGIMIKSRRKIVINYLKSQAVYDLFAFGSLLIALQFTVDNSTEKIGWQLLPYSIFYMVRLFKLQVRVHKLEEFFNFTGWAQDWVDLGKLLFIVVYVGHLFACLWHAVAFYYIGIEHTWIEEYQLQNRDSFTRYNYAFYWAVQTMITVGYGDINPQNNLERGCANISMFLACGVFAFSFNSIGQMLYNLNQRKDQFKKSTNLLNSFLTKNQIKTDLQSRVRNYYEYIFEEEQEINEEEVQAITTKLSNSLQDELKFEIRMNVMKMCKVLTKFSQKTLYQLSLSIEEVRFSPEDYILQQNTSDDSALYLITKGTVLVMFTDKEDRNTRILGQFTKGQSFGEYGFFTGLNRTASARSSGFSRAYKINRSKFLSILQNQPQDLERFCEIKDSMLLYNNNQPAKLTCFACEKYNHLINQCPILHFVADKEKVLKKEMFPFEQERNKDFRRLQNGRHYFPTLKEMKKIMFMCRKIQTIQNQNDNVTIVDDEGMEVSYDEEYEDPNDPNYCIYSNNELASFSKSLSKISRQQSQKGSVNQQQDNPLQAIQESEDSGDSMSPNRQRPKVVKQTINTAGFGGMDSLQAKFSLHNSQVPNNNIEQDEITLSRNDEPKFSLIITENVVKENRPSHKRMTLLRKAKREESVNNPSQSLIPILEPRDRSNSNIQKNKLKIDSNNEIALSPSLISGDKDPQQKKKSYKTQRTRTARSQKTSKLDGQIPSQQNQEIIIPIYENGAFSMELEQFEQQKIFQYYFSWNNCTAIVQRANRTFKLALNKKKFGNEFSLYTFSFYAMSKALRMRKKKMKFLNDEQQMMESQHPSKYDKKGSTIPKINVRKGNKRQTHQDDLGLTFHRKPNFGTQIQPSALSNRFS